MVDPVLIDLPMPITTKRLVIRPAMPGEGKMVAEAVNESLKELSVWMPWAQTPQTGQEAEINVRRAYAQWILREDLRMHIYDRKTEEFVGGTGFHRMNWAVPRLEIGYWVRTRYSGQGLITETVAAMTKYAIEALGARRLEIRCDEENTRSAAVAERLGYTLEATFLCDSVKPNSDQPRNTRVYVRLDAKNIMDVGASW